MIFSRKRSRAAKRSNAVTTTSYVPQPEIGRAPITTPASVVPEELIAARAYEKWQLRGCPMGQDGTPDWFAAKAELEEERLGWAAPEPGDRARGV